MASWPHREQRRTAGSGPDAYTEPPEGPDSPDPRTAGAVRIPDFYARDGDVIRCWECGTEQDLGAEWLDARIRDAVGCPGCGIVSRIAVDDPERPPAKTKDEL